VFLEDGVLDIRVDNALAQVHGVGNVPGGPLSVFAEVDQHVSIARCHCLLVLSDIGDLFDARTVAEL